MSVLRIGSLCSGYGGLDLAVMDVLGGTVAWHAQYDPDDKHQYAARILEHRFPGVPNHGDITAVDWTTVEPVDVLTAGFPCQPISHAGLRKAQDDARWIWPAVARAVRTLRPRLVVLENVSALVVRGLSDVLGDLAAIRFDAEWLCLPASDVGAPHKRERCFVLAWPASDAGCDPWPQDHSDFGSAAGRGRGTGVPSVALGGRAAAPAATGIAEREPADDENPVAGSREARPELGGRSLPDREREREREDGGVIRLLPTPRTTDANGAGNHGSGGPDLRTTIRTLTSTGDRTPQPSDAGRP